MHMNSFSITKTLQIYLYGYNTISERLSIQLKQAGYQVMGIIDRNAGVYNDTNSFTVLTMEQLCMVTIDKEKVAIVVCVRNAMLHRQIVENLINCGFGNILYIPMENLGDREITRKMMYAYHSFLDGNFELMNEIPKTNIIYSYNNKDNRLIYDEGEQIIFYCDIEDIFVPDEKWYSQKSPYVLEIEDFLFDVPIIHSYQHRELFLYYKGKVDDPVSGSNFIKNTIGWEQRKKDRIDLWNLFVEWLQQGMYMFSIHASSARWNKKGVFYLTDGGHRIFFLYHHNIFRIPVRATKEDYKEYIASLQPKEYIYKSIELLLQEQLFDKVDVSDKTVLLIGGSETNRFFERCSRKIYYCENAGEIEEMCNEADYVFYSDRYMGSEEGIWMELLKSKCRKIFYETWKNISNELGVGADWCIETVASAVQSDMKITKVYGIYRKEK